MSPRLITNSLAVFQHVNGINVVHIVESFALPGDSLQSLVGRMTCIKTSALPLSCQDIGIDGLEFVIDGFNLSSGYLPGLFGQRDKCLFRGAGMVLVGLMKKYGMKLPRHLRFCRVWIEGNRKRFT